MAADGILKDDFLYFLKAFVAPHQNRPVDAFLMIDHELHIETDRTESVLLAVIP